MAYYLNEYLNAALPTPNPLTSTSTSTFTSIPFTAAHTSHLPNDMDMMGRRKGGLSTVSPVAGRTFALFGAESATSLLSPTPPFTADIHLFEKEPELGMYPGFCEQCQRCESNSVSYLLLTSNCSRGAYYVVQLHCAGR